MKSIYVISETFCNLKYVKYKPSNTEQTLKPITLAREIYSGSTRQCYHNCWPPSLITMFGDNKKDCHHINFFNIKFSWHTISLSLACFHILTDAMNPFSLYYYRLLCSLVLKNTLIIVGRGYSSHPLFMNTPYTCNSLI